MTFREQLRYAFDNFGIRNVAEIIIIVAVVYFCLALLKKNNALGLAKYFLAGIAVSLVLAWRRTGLTLVRPLLLAVPFALVVLTVALCFSDFRRTMFKFGSSKEDKSKYGDEGSDEERRIAVKEISRAILNMAKRDCGALIVLVRDAIQPHIAESGIRLDAQLSGQLLESLFNPKGSLHDGAVLIKGGKILAAGCFLNLTQDISVDKELGTRHRAGIGVTESNNVTAIIISEETGVISVAKAGGLTRYIDSDMLTAMLEEFYGLAERKSVKKRKVRV